MQDNRVWYHWLTKRGITDSIISDFNVHWGTHPVMGDCIVIPVINEQGFCTFNKYRRDPMVDAKPKYLYDAGSKTTLYGYWRAKNCDRVLVTEGEMDALVAWSANIPAVSSTGGATSFQPEWAELLKDKEVVFCFDNDGTGGTGMVKALEILPRAKVMFLPDRPGVKDISDYVGSGSDLNELLKTAIHFDGLQDVIDHRSTRLAVWQSTYFHDAYIAHHTKPEYVRKEVSTSDEVARARTYPIPKLVKIRKDNTGLCIWHNEKTPSMHYYKETNTVYCFGCSKHGDVIAVYRQLHNCTFREAIQKLL